MRDSKNSAASPREEVFETKIYITKDGDFVGALLKVWSPPAVARSQQLEGGQNSPPPNYLQEGTFQQNEGNYISLNHELFHIISSMNHLHILFHIWSLSFSPDPFAWQAASTWITNTEPLGCSQNAPRVQTCNQKRSLHLKRYKTYRTYSQPQSFHPPNSSVSELPVQPLAAPAKWQVSCPRSSPLWRSLPAVSRDPCPVSTFCVVWVPSMEFRNQLTRKQIPLVEDIWLCEILQDSKKVCSYKLPADTRVLCS